MIELIFASPKTSRPRPHIISRYRIRFSWFYSKCYHTHMTIFLSCSLHVPFLVTYHYPCRFTAQAQYHFINLSASQTLQYETGIRREKVSSKAPSAIELLYWRQSAAFSCATCMLIMWDFCIMCHVFFSCFVKCRVLVNSFNYF